MTQTNIQVTSSRRYLTNPKAIRACRVKILKKWGHSLRKTMFNGVIASAAMTSFIALWFATLAIGMWGIDFVLRMSFGVV